MFDALNSEIAERLIRATQNVSVAESSTGGLISANLLSVPGASSYYLGGSVVYTLASRRAFLKINKEKFKDLKPLTVEMAQAFADAARETLDTTWAIAELGATGPTGTPYGHGPGVSVIGISGPAKSSRLIETHSDNRQDNMHAFTEAALILFNEVLQKQEASS